MTASQDTQQPPPPINYDELVARIIQQHGSLAKSFQRVARYVIQNPNEVAFRSSKQIAERIGVQASTLVRFAQMFGYSGFSEMQIIFRARLASAVPGFPNSGDTVPGIIGTATTKSGTLRGLASLAAAALQRMVDTIDEQSIARSGALLRDATTVHIFGQRRSFPIAAYLRYALLTCQKDCRLIDDSEGLLNERVDIVKQSDVFVVVNFRYHGRESHEIAEALSTQNVPIILITDNPLSPVNPFATEILQCPEDEGNFSNSIAAPLCVAQALSMAMAAPATSR